MAQYTTLKHQDINSILALYNNDIVKSYIILSGGSENTNYLVTTNNSKFVLTVCEHKSLKAAIELTKLLNHLANHNFSTSKVLSSIKNKPIITWNNKPVMLKEYIEGKIMKNLPSHLLESIGKTLAELHQIKAPNYVSNVISYGKEKFREVAAYDSKSTFRKWLEEIHKYVLKKTPKALPKALIHSDLFYNNVIINNSESQATIMDFEEASYYYRVFDIGMAIVGLCSENAILDLQKAQCILKGYQDKNKLKHTETNSLKVFTVYAAAATAFWRHKHFRVDEPDSKKLNHYLEMKNLADYIKLLPDDCFTITST